jgi:hypothetical protein
VGDKSKISSEAFSKLNQDLDLCVCLAECYQQMLTLGYIIPHPQRGGGFNPQWFYVTKLGKEWAASKEPIPEDWKGYLETLDRLVPNLDSVIREYVKEALLTYERRTFFASAVMIGAASEKAIYLLMEALLQAVSGSPEEKAVQRAMGGRDLCAMFKKLSDNIHRAKSKSTGAMPRYVHEEADHHLLSLQDAIRVQRNNAVHPQTGQVIPTTVRLTLAAFPFACRKVYDLIELSGSEPTKYSHLFSLSISCLY